jgi:hypothetical protein
MTKDYDVPRASVTWIEATGQMQYVLTWDADGVLLSGTNLNDGVEWASPTPVEQPDRFGPCRTVVEFFTWAAKFAAETDA